MLAKKIYLEWAGLKFPGFTRDRGLKMANSLAEPEAGAGFSEADASEGKRAYGSRRSSKTALSLEEPISPSSQGS